MLPDMVARGGTMMADDATSCVLAFDDFLILHFCPKRLRALDFLREAKPQVS